MALITLQKMVMSGFRSFAEEATVVFTPSGMVLVRGKNADTGGSSGSGKSNVLLALAYAFDYCPLPAKDLQSWHSDKPARVDVWFDAGGECHLSRGVKPFLKFPGGEVSGARAVNAKLSEIVGLDSEMLAALTFRQQQSRGLFLSKNDSEKKEFLTKLLRLDTFEEQYENANKTANEAQRQLDVLQGKLDLLKQEAARLLPVAPQLDSEANAKDWQEATAALFAKAKGACEAAEEELRKAEAVPLEPQGEEYRELRRQHTAAKLELDTAAKNLPRYVRDERKLTELRSVAAEIKKRHDVAQTKIGDLRSRIVIRKEGIAKEPGYIREHDRLVAQINALKTAKCPECQKPLDAAEIQKSLAEKEKELADWQEDLAGVARMREANVLCEQEMAETEELAQQLWLAHVNVNQQAEEEYRRLRVEEVEFEKNKTLALFALSEKAVNLENQIRELLSAHQARVRAERDRLCAIWSVAFNESEIARSEMSIAEGNVEQVRKTNALKTEQYQMQQAAHADALQRVTKAEAELNVVKDTWKREDDFAKAVKAFLGYIFDESLVAIADETNKLLAQLPNVAHVTLSFRSEATNAKGLVKQEIRPVIHVNGNETTLAGGCSGGQKTSIELAVDLAVATVVQQRTGTAPGWIILDETFDGMDVHTKECCAELLKTYAISKLVLVVDHATETKELFTSFVDVHFANGKSTVVDGTLS